MFTDTIQYNTRPIQKFATSAMSGDRIIGAELIIQNYYTIYNTSVRVRTLCQSTLIMCTSENAVLKPVTPLSHYCT